MLHEASYLMLFFVLFGNPFEILLNAGKDLFRLAWAELVNQPLFCVFITLAIVASTVAILPIVTQRHNISGCCTGASWDSERNPVIHSDDMPQSSGPTADGAAMIEVFKTALPIVNVPIVRQLSFSRSIPYTEYANLIPIVFAPQLIALEHFGFVSKVILFSFLRVLQSIGSTVCPALLRMFFLPACDISINARAITPFVGAAICSCLFWIAPIYAFAGSLDLLYVFDGILSLVVFNFILVSIGISLRILDIASSAPCVKSIAPRLSLPKVFSGWRIFGCTLRASPKGIGDIQHSVHPYANIHDVCGQGGGCAASSVISLDHSLILPQIGAVR